MEKENRKAQQNIKRILQKAQLIARSLNRPCPTAYIINDLRVASYRRTSTRTYSDVVQHPRFLNVYELLYTPSDTPKVVVRHYILSRGGKDYLLKHLYKCTAVSAEFSLELTQEQYSIQALSSLIENGRASTNFASFAAAYFQYLQTGVCNREIALEDALEGLRGLLSNASLDGRYLTDRARDFVLQLYLTRQFADERSLQLMGQTFAACALSAADVAYSAQRIQIILNDLMTAHALDAALFLTQCNVDFVIYFIYYRVSTRVNELSVGIRYLLARLQWEKLANFDVQADKNFLAALQSAGVGK